MSLLFFLNMRIILFISCFIFAIAILPAQTPNDEPEPSHRCFNAKAPKCLNLTEVQNKLILPQEAIEMNLSGKVIVRMLIDEEGCYVKHLPPRSGHPILIKAVEKYLPELRFEPATQNGKLIKYWINVPFSFRPQ